MRVELRAKLILNVQTEKESQLLPMVTAVYAAVAAEQELNKIGYVESDLLGGVKIGVRVHVEDVLPVTHQAESCNNEDEMLRRVMDLIGDYSHESFVVFYNRMFYTKLTVDDVDWNDGDLKKKDPKDEH